MKNVIVNNKRAGLIGFEKHTLMPGANKISLDEANIMKAHPVIKAMVEDGILDFCESSEEEGLSGISSKEAVELVESTSSIEVLESFKSNEKRKPVLASIEKQISKIQEPTKFRSGNKSEKE